jgi:hypothetical protein
VFKPATDRSFSGSPKSEGLQDDASVGAPLAFDDELPIVKIIEARRG